MMIQVLIADDHSLFRKSLRGIIERQGDMRVIAEAEDGIVAIKQAKQFQPDVILMDVSMPKMDGINAARQISANFSNIKIIALSSYSEELYHEKMIEAGARDYLSKVCSREDLLECIRSVFKTEPSDETGTYRQGIRGRD
jgi:DNA-binding NarL/FixJ family response regulator